MSKRIQPIPVVPSFPAWQKAADKLLTLETELARSKRAVVDLESPDPAELEASVATARVIADRLFQTAFAEANLARGKRQAPSALASILFRYATPGRADAAG